MSQERRDLPQPRRRVSSTTRKRSPALLSSSRHAALITACTSGIDPAAGKPRRDSQGSFEASQGSRASLCRIGHTPPGVPGRPDCSLCRRHADARDEAPFFADHGHDLRQRARRRIATAGQHAEKGLHIEAHVLTTGCSLFSSRGTITAYEHLDGRFVRK